MSRISSAEAKHAADPLEELLGQCNLERLQQLLRVYAAEHQNFAAELLRYAQAEQQNKSAEAYADEIDKFFAETPQYEGSKWRYGCPNWPILLPECERYLGIGEKLQQSGQVDAACAIALGVLRGLAAEFDDSSLYVEDKWPKLPSPFEVVRRDEELLRDCFGSPSLDPKLRVKTRQEVQDLLDDDDSDGMLPSLIQDDDEDSLEQLLADLDALSNDVANS
ncbi:MAG: hypothetical protein IJ228_02860 [Succinivibrio sp.]|nr:hypothetical protein [Succinivibrio sp.]